MVEWNLSASDDFYVPNGVQNRPTTPSLSSIDNGVSRKMTKIGFSRKDRVKILGIDTGNIISDVHKFAEKYGLLAGTNDEKKEDDGPGEGLEPVGK